MRLLCYSLMLTNSTHYVLISAHFAHIMLQYPSRIYGQENNYSNYLKLLQHQGKFNVQSCRVWFLILDSWVGMDSGNETSEYATVRTLVGCRTVRLPTSPDYARNVPIMLESVPIILALCSIFPRPYYARHYADIIRPSRPTSRLLYYNPRCAFAPRVNNNYNYNYNNFKDSEARVAYKSQHLKRVIHKYSY